MSFKKEDVLLVAKVLVEDAVMYRDGGDYEMDGYECEHCCGEKTVAIEDFKHETDCPVLVAQDLLTGAC